MGDDDARLGRELMQNGRFEDARVRFERALAATPGDARLRAAIELTHGYQAKREGRTGDARRHFRAALEADPGCQEAIAELRSRPGA